MKKDDSESSNAVKEDQCLWLKYLKQTFGLYQRQY